MHRNWNRVRKVVALSIVLSVVTVLATTSLCVTARLPGLTGSTDQAVSPSAGTSADSLVSSSGVVLYAEQLYASFEHTPVGAKPIDGAAFPPANTISAKVLTLFGQVSQQSSFTELFNAYGPGGFSYGFAGEMTSGLSNVFFDFNVIGTTTTSTISWEGNLSGMTISGPFTVIRPSLSMNSVFQSGNWAGSSWWGSGSPTPTLESTGFDEQYPTMSLVGTQPQNLPSGDKIGQEAAIWVGLTNSNSYLLQTGAYTDVSTGGSGGQIFYELACPSGDSCPNSAEYYPTGGSGSETLQVVPVGHWAVNDIWEGSSSKVWNLEEQDWTSYTYNTVNWNIGSWVPNGYNPQWTQYIVETPEVGGLIQQLPYFSEVVVGDDFYCTTTDIPCGWHSYGQPYNQYQLEQSTSNDNTGQGYRNADCGFHGAYGCPTVSYTDSNYDYNYMLSHYGIG
jgi:hypothetical protein